MQRLLVLLVLIAAPVLWGASDLHPTPPPHPDAVPDVGGSGTFHPGLMNYAASIYADAFAGWTFDDLADLGNQDFGSCASCNLTEVNTPTATGGALGYAAKFTSASSQYASVSDPAGGELDPGSGVSWGYAGWGIIHTAGSNKAIISKALVLAASGEYDNFYVAAGGAHNCRFHDGTSTKLDGITPLPLVGSRFFYHCRYNATANELEAGFDATWSGSPTSTAGDGADQARAFTVAAHDGGGEAADLDLNSIVFYRSASGGEVLTDAMATSLYNSDKGKLCADMSGAELTNRVGCWDMTEAGGPYVDSQGSNDLTGVDTPTRSNGLVERSDSGMSGRVLNADGSYFEDTSFVVDYSTGLWVACWVNDGVGDAGSEVLWRVSDAGIEGILLSLGTNVFTGTVKADVSQLTGTAAYTQGQWHLVEAWWDSSDKKLYIAVDNSTTSSSSATGRAPANSTRIRFGDDFGGGVVPFETAFDNCAMWEKTPTTVERDALWDSGAGTFYAAFLDFIFNGPRFAWSQPPEIR